MKHAIRMTSAALAIATAILGNSTAYAAKPHAPRLDVCKTMMTCGEYAGTGTHWFKENNQEVGTRDIIESASISESGPNTIHFMVSYHRNDWPAERSFKVDLQLIFTSDGRYTASTKNGLYAVGLCRFQSCTFEFVPSKKDDAVSNMNSLIFQNGSMFHQMFVTWVAPTTTTSSTLFVELKKKP